MSTQQDIYAAGSENHLPMLNKENSVPWKYGYCVQNKDDKGFDIGVQEKKAKLFNEWEMFTSTDEESIESYCHRFLKLMNDFKRNKHFLETIASNLKIANQNGNGNVVVARAKGNAVGNNADLDEIEEVNAKFILMANLQQASTSEAAKFVQDFKSLAKEADESLAKHKSLELEIERLLRAVVSQDIMSIMQSNSVEDTSNLQTKLERTKERFENCIIKKENEYAKLWNDWYKKCDECKCDKISYDKAYNDMQQKIKRLQAPLGDQKGNSKDTPCVSNTLDSLYQKLEKERGIRVSAGKERRMKAKSTLLWAIPDEQTYCKFYESRLQKRPYGKLLRPGLDKTYDSKANLDEVSMDDLYKNLKVYEAEIKSQSSSSSNFQNVAFVSSDDTSSTNEAVNTAHDVPAASSKR
ncbi:hypothetical protein Tco_0876471 [Tanacetum coccineum]|uniref:Uncharacterized protein n=1 Tax=Tanacetum coccineum TaxID=301880 RepID=A0ABQ5BSG5_9ASTR